MIGIWDYMAAVALGLAIIVNSLSVYMHKTRQVYDRFGKRAWLVHQVVISFFWGLAVLAGFGLGYSSFEFSRTYSLLGAGVMLVAVVLFGLALQQIGFGALGNGNFFGQKMRRLGGIYRYMCDPIYISYVLWYVGLALATGKKTFALMAIIALVGLKIEALVEKSTSSTV